jgi:ABC-2 type transport system ATP-binding protein
MLMQVASLNKSYKHVPALRGISFDVRIGEIVAFLGPNGAGKTTTINILTGLLRPDSGTVRHGGNVFDPQNAEQKRMIGVVPQHNNLERDLTVEQTMRIHAMLYGLSEYKPRMEALLATVDLLGQRDRLTTELSGGMKRRLVIARALLHKPQLLFLDEPTAGLDPVSRRSIHALIQQLNQEQNVSVFLTTHYIEEADTLAQRVILIDDGRIVLEGKPSELKVAAQTADNTGDQVVTLEDVYIKAIGSVKGDYV